MPSKKIKKSRKSRPVENSEWEVTDITEEAASGSLPAASTVESDSEVLDNSELTEDISEQTTESAEAEENSNLNTKKKRKRAMVVQRSEASQNISEFNLNEVGKERIKLTELIKTSQKLAGQTSVKKQLENAKKLRSLSVPMSKPQMQKIKRAVAYEKVCDEVSKWDSVVNSNRAADQIIYPLKKPHLSLETFEKASETFVTKHPVEIAVAELLDKSENKLVKTQPLTVAEEKALQAMSLEEAKLRHNELMKHRALISYQEAKARRQNKIKSKSYHRILKKEKLKKILKEFEELEKVDAAAALEKIMEADKLRVLERMTLKHRNTGKWAKIQKLRAKYNPDARSVLKEDLNIGRQFKEKRPMIEKSIDKLKSTLELEAAAEEEEENVYEAPGLLEEATGGGIGADVLGTSEVSTEPEISDKWLANPSSLLDKLSVEQHLGLKNTNKVKKPRPAKTQSADSEFVDMEFISKATPLDSYNPNIGENMEDESEDDGIDDDGETMAGVKSVSEAFEDEDLIAEFREDKKAANQNSRAKGIDLYLPGWGSWTGPKIKDSKQKRRRFFIKPPEDPAPKKNSLGSVIINEEKDKKAQAHQVNHLPFPFTNVTQFESYIRQPLGHTWNPQSSFQNLNAPKVITKMGKVIEPIDAEDEVVANKTSKRPVTKKGGEKPKRKKRKAPELKAF